MSINKKNICIIGLGYVGLTLATVLVEEGFKVYGIEKDPNILNTIRQGKAHFFERGLNNLIRRHLNIDFFIYDSIPRDKKIDSFIITVGTPVEERTKKTIIRHLIRAAEEIRESLEDGQLVILRSTVAPGTTREIVLPIFKESGKRFYLAFCPERTVEGVALKELRTLPQVIGGLDEESIRKAREIFQELTEDIVEVPSLEYAEMNKIVCNTYRDVTFAFANEIAILARKFGLDADKLIKTANLGYPRADIPRPGFVGGACLSKDSYILSNMTRDKINFTPKLINTARQLNELLPVLVANKIEKTLKSKESSLNLVPVKVFISGFAFKGRPETDDLRNSPTLDLLRELENRGITNIYGHDFAVNRDKIEKLGVKVSTIQEGFRDADVVLIMTNHISYDNLSIENLLLSMKKGGFFFDAWQIFEPERIKNLGYVVYESLGTDGNVF